MSATWGETGLGAFTVAAVGAMVGAAIPTLGAWGWAGTLLLPPVVAVALAGRRGMVAYGLGICIVLSVAAIIAFGTSVLEGPCLTDAIWKRLTPLHVLGVFPFIGAAVMWLELLLFWRSRVRAVGLGRLKETRRALRAARYRRPYR